MAKNARTHTARPSYIVIGASAAGVAALLEIFKNLPADLPATVLMVLHIRPEGSLAWLADRLVGVGRFPVKVGITIVQNPERAESGDMPRNAMRGLNVDYCLELAEIGPLLDLLVRRAGSMKQGVLETGLASAVRLLKDRVRLLASLYAQSEQNPKTARFLKTEITALDREIAVIRRLIPRERTNQKKRRGNLA